MCASADCRHALFYLPACCALLSMQKGVVPDWGKQTAGPRSHTSWGQLQWSVQLDALRLVGKQLKVAFLKRRAYKEQ